MNSYYSDPEIEKKVLINILHDIEQLNYVINSVGLFNIFNILSHQRLFNLICRYHKKYYSILHQSALEVQLKRELYPDKEKIDIMLLFQEVMTRIPDTNTRFYIDTLKELYIKNDLRVIFNSLKTRLENETKSPSTILPELTREILQVSQKLSDEEVKRTSLLEGAENRWVEYNDREQYPEKYKGTPFGFKDIDNATGGIFKEHVGLIFARSGKGKSRLLYNIGCNAALVGRSVMYITIEMSTEALQNMWASRQLKLSYTQIVNSSLSLEDKERYNQFLHNNQNEIPFYIVDMPRGCTPPIVEAELITYTRMYGKVPDLVLIDYANLMRPDTKYEKGYEKYDNLLRELKQVARVHKIPIVTAMQQNRESLKAKEVGLEHIGLSDRAADHCDFILHLHREDKDDVNKTLHIRFVKARFSELKACTLYADFAINYISDWEKLRTDNSQTPVQDNSNESF